jgi:hypothetical protein
MEEVVLLFVGLAVIVLALSGRAQIKLYGLLIRTEEPRPAPLSKPFEITRLTFRGQGRYLEY